MVRNLAVLVVSWSSVVFADPEPGHSMTADDGVADLAIDIEWAYVLGPAT